MKTLFLNFFVIMSVLYGICVAWKCIYVADLFIVFKYRMTYLWEFTFPGSCKHVYFYPVITLDFFICR